MNNILAPISFSETSGNALKSARHLANEYGATLTLMHCYPAQDYNREYDFGSMEYTKGIKLMLSKFYTDNAGASDKNFKLLCFASAVSDVISDTSHNYDLIVLGRRIGFQSASNRWFSEKIFYFTTKSTCPTLLLPTKKEAFSFSGIKNIWHIQRSEIEPKLIAQELLKIKVNPNLVVSKNLQQKTFTSTFWHNIVNYTKDHDKDTLAKISESFADEHIDLLIIVNHRKGLFEGFVKDDAFQIISQFDIPILVLQARLNK